jgi:anaerobic magnesium-protoporphyrin IX monomethyl ester cyclase
MDGIIRRSMTLVVNPNNRLRTPLAAIEPPLWAGLITSYLKADILDAEALDLTLDETVNTIEVLKPDKVIIVVMGNNPSVSSTPKIGISEALAEGLKKDYSVSLTGIHPVSVGSKYPVIKKPFEGFPDMPFDKLPMDLYKAHNWHCLDGSPRSPYASVYTSLGCPFNCYYCNIHTLYPDRKMQFRPIANIMKEIDTLTYKYGVRNIKFWDELFALDEVRVLSICEQLQYYDLNIWAYARVDTITKGMLKVMKKAGINWLVYGFEGVSDKKFIRGTENVIKMTRDAGISIMGNFMFGAPNTTPDDDMGSLEFAKKHLFEFVNFYDAKPYPGSQWYKDTKPQDIEYNQYKQISPFRDKAWMDYFTNPEYLSMIGKKWGQQAINQINYMIENKI